MLESDYIVTVDDERVTCTTPDGTAESMAWAELEMVVIETNDQGPFVPDVFWILVGTHEGNPVRCVVPQGATGEEALLDKLQALPNFNNESLIEAMSCVENHIFICWEK